MMIKYLRKLQFPILFLLFPFVGYTQVTLQADGPGDTYDLIASVLAPDYNPIEVPDCGHASFGEHIDEIFDADLNAYVFRFHIHKSPDNDRCIKFDRQRNEIKTYDKSPANLKGTVDEIVEYKWKFKISSDFQPSGKFTHLFQLKAVGGSESSMPLITLTARKATPDRLELRHAEALSATTLLHVPLESFKGEWIEAAVSVAYGEYGAYNIQLNRISDGNNLMSYDNDSIRMWKTDAEFIRPKWGIYRSLLDSTYLKDEIVLFNDFSIAELAVPVGIDAYFSEHPIGLFPNPTSNNFTLKGDLINYEIHILDIMGTVHQTLSSSQNTLSIDLSTLPNGYYFIQLHNMNGQLVWVEKILKQ